MKNKKRNLPKTRNNLPKRIAAESDAEKASRLAFHGRHLSEIEIGVLHYLQSRESLARCIAAKHAEHSCEVFGEALKELIFEAVNRRDGSPLRILADAVEAFDPKPTPVDLKRAAILAIKSIKETRGETLTVSEWARTLSKHFPGDATLRKPSKKEHQHGSDDGFSQLRRLLKELGILVAKGKLDPTEIKTRKGIRVASKS